MEEPAYDTATGAGFKPEYDEAPSGNDSNLQQVGIALRGHRFPISHAPPPNWPHFFVYLAGAGRP